MTLPRSLRFALVALASLSVAGCGFIFESKAERAMRGTPNFKSGYSDGCATANSQGVNYDRNQVRDDYLYNSDRAYRAGWAAGVSSCRSGLAPQPGVPGGLIPDTNPGR